MSEEKKNKSLEKLKNDMLQKQRSAENAAYMYACACDLGPEREEAFLIYEKNKALIEKLLAAQDN